MLELALGVSAATWGVVMALSPVLQMRRMIARRSSHDVSIGYFLVLLFGFGLWAAYGASLGNPVIIIPNCIALAIGAATIAVARRYRHERA